MIPCVVLFADCASVRMIAIVVVVDRNVVLYGDCGLLNNAASVQ